MDAEWIIRLEGRVQGVGLRGSVSRAAHMYQIRGYARNCSDGSVEICAQGTAQHLERFLDTLRHRPGIGTIKTSFERGLISRPYHSFDIF